MKLQKFRWSKVYESQEEELVNLLAARNIEGKVTDVEEFATVGMTPDKDITIWCAEGSFKLEADDQSISMQPGDALPVKQATEISVVAGMSGCTFYETVNTNS